MAVTRTEGNPIRSALVNALIKRGKKGSEETWGGFADSTSMLGHEFVVMHNLLNQNVFWQAKGAKVHMMFLE